MQVYTAVYCHGTGSVLVFRKKEEGFFFRRQLPSTGGRIRRGSKGGIVLNGGGSYCLPGGKLEAGESPERGALREFLEETGIDLGTYRQEIPPVRVEPSGSQRLYCGVVFCYGRIVFDAVYTAVAVKVEAKERALRRLFAESGGCRNPGYGRRRIRRYGIRGFPPPVILWKMTSWKKSSISKSLMPARILLRMTVPPAGFGRYAAIWKNPGRNKRELFQGSAPCRTLILLNFDASRR